MKTSLIGGLVLATSLIATAHAAEYKIDTKGAHAFINFEIQHLGYSWLSGRFDDFEGTFHYDADNPNASKVNVTIDVASVNSNHAERDKHLRGDDFFEVDTYPQATFSSTEFVDHGDGTATLSGDFTLKGVTKNIDIDVTHVGGGEDPWGGYRQGFRGTTELTLADYNIDYNLGPKSKTVQLTLDVEGIRQ